MQVDSTPVAQTPTYYTYKKHHCHCKKCMWQGLGSELRQGELFGELFELDCPSCSETVTFVPYPTIDESRANWNLLSERERAQVERIEEHQTKFDAMSLKTTEQLPGIAAPAFSLIWDYVDNMTVLRLGETVIFSEPALYEGYERFEEVALILKERYGTALIDLVPSQASWFYLYGDAISSSSRLQKFRRVTFNLAADPDD